MFGTKAAVLVVAGDESVRETCAEVLSERHEVSVATGLADASAVVESESIDVVLVAATLPDGTSSALVDRLRERGAVPRTALLAEEPFEPDGTDPFDAVIPTPPSASDLESVVNRLTACKRYDDRIERFYALSVACADLAERLDASDLATSDAYTRLCAERDEAAAAADDALAAVDRDDRVALVPDDGDASNARPNSTRNTQCEIHD